MIDAALDRLAAALVALVPTPPQPSAVAWIVILVAALWVLALPHVRVIRRGIVIEGLVDALLLALFYRWTLVLQTTPFPRGFGKGGYSALYHALALDRAKADVVLATADVAILLVAIVFTFLPVRGEAQSLAHVAVTE